MVEGKSVFNGVEIQGIRGELPGHITGLACDSRAVKEGDLFVALRGQRVDGHDYLADVHARQACAAVVDHFCPPENLLQIRVQDTLCALPQIAANYYHHPAQELKLVGITGSNGKTTCSYILESIFNAAGEETGVIGTIEYRYKNHHHAAPNTTPLAHDMHRLLRDISDAGCERVVMEVSSHGLMLHRVDAIQFETALFTNLSQDHLDFHKSMDEYREAKKRLFTKHLKTGGTGVINRDDETGRMYENEIKDRKTLTFAIDRPADFRAVNIALGLKGSRFILQNPENLMLTISTPLLGRHNIYNILGSAAAAWAAGVPLNLIEKGIAQFQAVPGRLEPVPNAIGAQVVVDYCHTPDALDKCLQALRTLPHNRILTVFGCGGDRDTGKRPQMGKIALNLSDVVFLTSDNPRTEDPQKILREIEAGMNQPGKHYTTIENRREAIRAAAHELREGDILLIAGKGHEDYQIIGNEKIHFDDREAARDCLIECGKGEA